ncbi:BglII/BstYI family type II restriction endonuclease [Marasmitruncus massiliensis]|uniref:BglII/BstYI family type II restriction endonuclease n=1 Tax=Marasmitruncus massiliensis TaxID=1944642 RepID=UPI000C7E7046|nr:BglII/BstYI family type II restriction endonuclease [Marasmitruncus massiliensis]
MMIKLKSYRSGLDVVPHGIVEDIKDIFQSTNIDVKSYAASAINKSLSSKLKQFGWSDSVRLDNSSKISITSMLHGIGLCLQTGNVSRTYADLLKLQTLYMKEIVRVGIIIVPMSSAAKKLGGNLASFERLSRELPIFKQVITMPILLVGFYE